MKQGVSWAVCCAIALASIIYSVNPAYAALTHRYGFATDGTDSLGGPAWTANGGPTFDGQVHFDGINDYLSLAASPLPGTSATIEIWGTYDPATADGSRIFDFSTVAGNAGWYQYLTPKTASDNTRWGLDDGFGIEFAAIEAAGNSGQEVLYTLVYDSTTVTTLGNGQFRMFRDGTLVATEDAESIPIFNELSPTTSNRLGHGTSAPVDATASPPAYLTGSINEFRTYNTPLTQNEILTSAVAGPNNPNPTFTDKTWNQASSDWNTPGNWTASGVPTTVNRAIIANGGTATVSGAAPVSGTARITNGTLAVGAGGTLESQLPIELLPGDSNSAAINVSGGGRLTISGILNDGLAGAKTINIDNGTVAAGFKSAFVSSGPLTVVGAGGATLDTGSGTMTWRSELSGSGNVTKTGSGTLVLRPSDAQLTLGPELQNVNFTGEFYVSDSTLDIQLEPGVLGRGGTTGGGSLHLDNSSLLVNTGYPIGGGLRKRVPMDLHVSGDSSIVDFVERIGTEIRHMGSFDGDGTIEYTKPNLTPEGVVIDNSALGVDFENADFVVDGLPTYVLPTVMGVPGATVGATVDNTNFTGRLIFSGDWAIRIRGRRVVDPDNPEAFIIQDKTDFPNAIVDLNHPQAWLGKRGTDPNQVIRLGGVAGVAVAGLDVDNPDVIFYSRLTPSIAGSGTVDVEAPDFNDVTFQIGGASQDAVFNGRIEDVVGADFVDQTTVVKVGDNTQTFAGPNTYSGTTTVNGGTLLINGTHARDALQNAYPGAPLPAANALPVGDYTVNSGGTLGGTGSIGSAADPVDIHNNGGTIAPGASIGTLTANGNVTFGASSSLDIEVDGTLADTLAVVGNLDLTALGTALNVTGSGSGSWVIATYTGLLSGEFESMTSGITIDYGSGANGQITIMGTLSTAGLIGDYNNDGKVNAADYTVWRNNLGGDESLLGSNRDPANSGNIGQDDYDSWKARFGETSPPSSGGASAVGVPEPASFVLIGLAAALVGLRRRR